MKDFLFELYNNSSGIDLIFLIISIVLAIASSVKGFVVSLLSASKWVISYVLTIILFPKAKPYVKDLSKNEYVLDIILGIFIFIIILFLIIMIARGMNKVIRVSHLGKVDTFFGFFFGILKSYVFCVCIFTTINNFFDYKKWPINIDESVMLPYIKKGSYLLIEEFPTKKQYEDTKEKVQEI
tara:strand:- start:64 stop:609 length:546 start_codon:yes stop_codon:yes gene_type:complete